MQRLDAKKAASATATPPSQPRSRPKRRPCGAGTEARARGRLWRLEKKKAALLKANDEEQTARSQEIATDEEALQEEKEKL